LTSKVQKTGGPAFPAGERYELKEGWQLEEGMTLRDYFAAKAMQALIGINYLEAAPGKAYKMADAMLIERNK
jgi:hypothetical protein